QAPENIKHYYGIATGTDLLPDPDGSYRLQVTTVSVGSNGVMPPLPPPQYQAPGMVVSSGSKITWPEPHVVFGTDPNRPELGDSVCVVDGYAPGPVWYTKGDLSGSPSNPAGPGTNIPTNPLTLAYQKGFAAGVASKAA